MQTQWLRTGTTTASSKGTTGPKIQVFPIMTYCYRKNTVYIMRDLSSSFFSFFFSFVISTLLNYLTSISKCNGVLPIAKTRLLFVSGKTADGTKRVSCCMLWYQHIWLRLSTFFFFPKATYCFLSLTKFCSIKRINMPLSALSVILFSFFSNEKKMR